MNFKELKARLWWACSDVDPIDVLGGGYDGILINEAIRDLAEVLNITKNATVVVTREDGVLNLPDDLLELLRITDSSGAVLQAVRDVNAFSISYTDDSDEPSGTRYFMLDRRTLQIIPAPPLSSSFLLWYKAYPTLLVNDDDVPYYIPDEHHIDLADIYGRGMVARRLGDFNLYDKLLTLWTLLKKQIAGKIDSHMFQCGTDTRRWVW